MAAAGLLVAAGAVWFGYPTDPPQMPGDHAPMPVCASADGTLLHADVDGDGHVDKVRDPERDGRFTVVADGGDHPWEADADQALNRQQRRSLESSGLETRGTFGDFDGDGYVDLALFFSEPHLGDDPVDNMPVHEVRYGPLAGDLTSERVGPIRIRWGAFVYGVRATDQDGDGRAELQVFQTAGDGGVNHYAGRQDDGGVTVDEEQIEFHDRSSWQETELGWSDFGLCSEN